MIRLPQFLSAVLRGHALMALAAYALPFLVLMILGMVWLAETGWLLQFVLIVGGALAAYRLAVWWMLRRAARAATGAGQAPGSAPLVAANPDWTAAEAAVFAGICAVIEERTARPMPWPELQPLALEVVETAARDTPGGPRDILDFSAPEALLLANRVLAQLRRDLRDHVPFADSVSLSSLFWIWRHRGWVQSGADLAKQAWRIRRIVTNPPIAIAQEAQNILLGEASGTLQASAEAVVQRLILQEIARAAIDLYSGKLRYSDAELLALPLDSETSDAASRAVEDLPPRILVVGQVSAGKTSLVNALLREDRGETDLAPTTPGLVSHDLDLAETGFTLVDSEGIDGSAAVDGRLLTELLQADLILWVARADRPARAPDRALLDRLRAALAAAPARRAPRIIVAVTAMDLLLPGWPYPEHLLPPPARATLEAVLAAVAADLDQTIVLPVSTTAPEWNVAALAALIAQEAGEAVMVQRNRRRIEGGRRDSSLGAETARGARGALRLGRLAWRGWRGG